MSKAFGSRSHWLGVAAATWLAAQRVHANCAGPVTYDIEVHQNTVTITPRNEAQRGCPDAGGLLRQNAATGEAVRVADFCGPEPARSTENRAFIDECVPAGSYRYGFADPYACVSYSCVTDWFAEATVTTAADGCERSPSDLGPSSVGSVPWGKNAEICHYAGEEADDSSGCATLPPGTGTVFGLDLSAGIIALGVMWLRRRARRS